MPKRKHISNFLQNIKNGLLNIRMHHIYDINGPFDRELNFLQFYSKK